MKVKKIFLVFLFFVGGLFAQDLAKYEASAKLLEAMNMESSYSKLIEQITDSQFAAVPMTEAKKQKVNAFFYKHMGFEKIKEDLITLYAQMFTVKEMGDMAAFYKTPTGKKTIELMPVLSQKGAEIGMERIMPHMDELMQIVQETE